MLMHKMPSIHTATAWPPGDETVKFCACLMDFFYDCEDATIGAIVAPPVRCCGPGYMMGTITKTICISCEGSIIIR